MPNLVYCSLILSGNESEISQLKIGICGVDEDMNFLPIDFNKIIPMPPSLDLTHSETVKQLAIAKYINQSVEKHLEIFLRAEGKQIYESQTLKH